MPAILADLSIEARWIVPMTTRGRVLENHTLVVRDGRILDLLPSVDAAERYDATVAMRRPAHLVMPGMINTHTHAAMSLFRGIESPIAPLEQRFVGPEFVRDGVLCAIAEMLSSGITCFGDRYYYPDQCARAAGEQGVRTVIGLPVAEAIMRTTERVIAAEARAQQETQAREDAPLAPRSATKTPAGREQGRSP